MADQDELGAGIDATEPDDFDKMLADFTETDGQELPDEPVPVMDTAPTVDEPAAEATSSAKAKKTGRKAKPAAEPTVLAEPAEDDEDEFDFDALPESTKMEMMAGRAALEAKKA